MSSCQWGLVASVLSFYDLIFGLVSGFTFCIAVIAAAVWNTACQSVSLVFFQNSFRQGRQGTPSIASKGLMECSHGLQHVQYILLTGMQGHDTGKTVREIEALTAKVIFIIPLFSVLVCRDLLPYCLWSLSRIHQLNTAKHTNILIHKT